VPDVTPTPALGDFSRFAIGATAPTDKPIAYTSTTLGVEEEWVDPPRMRGSRSHAAGTARRGGRLVQGDVFLGGPTAVEWTYFLPYFLGGTPAASGTGFNYPLGEALAAFQADLLRGATLFRYTNCRGNQLVINSAPGQAVSARLGVLGVDETTPGGAFPSLTWDTGAFFQHEDSVANVSVNGTSINCFGLTVTVNNFVRHRRVNSLTATVVYSIDREVTWQVDVPWGDAESLYALAEAGVAVSATFVNGNTSMIISSPKVQFPRRSPGVPDRDEIHNVLQGMARYSATAGDEILIFVDATP
jgi:hypothetical protein